MSTEGIHASAGAATRSGRRRLVVPAGRDPYRIGRAITEEVVEATAESARQAEQEWQRAVAAQRGKVFSGKPAVGGVEIAVRYLTRTNERLLLRAKPFHAAVDLLGERSVTQAPNSTEGRPDLRPL